MRLASSVFGDTVLHDKPLKTWVHFVSRLYKLFTNFISSQLMNDNFYAFSYDQGLLELSVEELAKKDVRLKYIQVDSMSKCVPQDWFLGYDQFSVYSFLNL